MDVFDLRGPEFLEFYLMLLGAMVLVAAVLRHMLRVPAEPVPGFAANLDPYETAYLAGGHRMAVDAALAGLVHCEAISIIGNKFSLKNGNAQPPSGFAQVVFDDISSGKSSVSRLHALARALAEPMAQRLRSADMALSRAQAAKVRLFPAGLILLVLLIGIAKIQVGLSRHRPVEILVILCVLTAVAALIFAVMPAYRTRAGDRVLKAMRHANSALKTTAKASPDRLAYNEVALALALFGPVVLAKGDLIGLRHVLFPAGTGGDGSGGSCGGGGGCGGGGCGGCGG
jgi:uncharacterized protein (TIGR04222 family)